VDGPADDVGDDDIPSVDRVVVGLSGEALGPRCERQQRRVAGEVRRFGETARAPDGQPGAGQPEGENLIGVHVEAVAEGSQERWQMIAYFSAALLNSFAERRGRGPQATMAPGSGATVLNLSIKRCAEEDSNLHGGIPPQGPQPCASTNSATGAGAPEYRPLDSVRWPH
jgi:hypothetical protein